MGLVFKNQRMQKSGKPTKTLRLSRSNKKCLRYDVFYGGHVIKDVYVSETRRLYSEAQAVKDRQSE